MRPYLRILAGLLLIFFGYKAITKEFDVYTDGLLSELDYLPLGLVLISTITVFLLDTSFFKLDRKLYQYSLSFLGLSICFIVFFKIIERNSIDNSKTILKVVNQAGASNVWQFDFKDSKHFTLTDYNLFGHSIYYGIYQKQGDTLKIIQSNYNGEVKKFPMTGIIKVDTVFWNGFDTMFIAKE